MRKAKEADAITTRLDELKKELDKVEDKRKGASPIELVKLDHEREDLEKLMGALETAQKDAQKAAEPEASLERDPLEDLMKGARKYEEDKAGKVAAIRKQIEGMEKRLQKIPEELEAAIQKADIKAITDLNREVDDLEAAIKYAGPVLEAANAAKAFPEGAIWNEWEKICESKRAEYEADVKDLEAMAEGYKAALSRLNRFYLYMMGARSRLAAMAEKDGERVSFATVLNKGSDTAATADRLKVTGTEKTIAMMYRPGYIL